MTPFTEFSILCYNGDRDAALACMKNAIENDSFFIDGFMDAIYEAAAEDDRPEVRECLAAVCDEAPDYIKHILDVNTSSFTRGADACWIPISEAYRRYYKTDK
jgi:hypothetical protein